MVSTLKYKEFKKGDYILIYPSQNPYQVGIVKEVHIWIGKSEPDLYYIEMSDGHFNYVYPLQMRKISKKRYFLEAI